MKVTIDSSESLDDTLRVIGALYDVTLTAASSAPQEQATPAETTRTSSRRNRGGRRTAKSATRSTRAPRKAAAKRAPRKAAAKRGSVNTAELRSWARDNGHEVSDRGPISASIATAYREAQQG